MVFWLLGEDYERDARRFVSSRAVPEETPMATKAYTRPKRTFPSPDEAAWDAMKRTRLTITYAAYA